MLREDERWRIMAIDIHISQPCTNKDCSEKIILKGRVHNIKSFILTCTECGEAHYFRVADMKISHVRQTVKEVIVSE